MPGSRLARLLPFLFVLLWSGAFVAVRAGIGDVSPLFFLAVRFAIASLVLVAIAAVRQDDWRPLRRVWPHLVVAGCAMNGLYLGAGYVAMTEISGATLALIGALNPLATALLSMPLLGERFRPVQWAGFALGTLGVALVVGVNLVELGNPFGVGLALASVLPLVGGTLYFSRFCRGVPVVQGNAVQLGSSAVLTALMTLAFEQVHAAWTLSALVSLAYLTFGVSLGGMGIYLFLLKHGTAGRVTSNFYLTPGTTAIMGWLILGEALSPLAIAGFVVASLGVWLVQQRRAG